MSQVQQLLTLLGDQQPGQQQQQQQQIGALLGFLAAEAGTGPWGAQQPGGNDVSEQMSVTMSGEQCSAWRLAWDAEAAIGTGKAAAAW